MVEWLDVLVTDKLVTMMAIGRDFDTLGTQRRVEQVDVLHLVGCTDSSGVERRPGDGDKETQEEGSNFPGQVLQGPDLQE